MPMFGSSACRATLAMRWRRRRACNTPAARPPSSSTPDLQDPPELIAQFVAKWREGYEVVYGVRQQRAGETMLKKLTSFLFYRLMGLIADVPIPADTGDFRLMDRRVLDVFRQFQEEPRFFRGLIGWIGFGRLACRLSAASASRGDDEISLSSPAETRFRHHHGFLDGPCPRHHADGPGAGGVERRVYVTVLVLWGWGRWPGRLDVGRPRFSGVVEHSIPVSRGAGRVHRADASAHAAPAAVRGGLRD